MKTDVKVQFPVVRIRFYLKDDDYFAEYNLTAMEASQMSRDLGHAVNELEVQGHAAREAKRR